MKARFVHGVMENGQPFLYQTLVKKQLEPNDIILHEGAYHRVITNSNKKQMVKLNFGGKNAKAN